MNLYWIIPFVVILLLIYVIFVGIKSWSGENKEVQALRKRFEKGELTKEQFEEMKKHIEDEEE